MLISFRCGAYSAQLKKHYKTPIKRHRKILFIKSDVLQFKVIIFTARPLSSQSRIIAIRSSLVKAVNFASTTSPTSVS